jgi:LAO/AO transport system kinase
MRDEGNKQPRRSAMPSLYEFVEGILGGDRVLLSRAITLVESSRVEHDTLAQQLLEQLHSHCGRTLRIGITGAPGVGKSCLIDALGNYLLDRETNRLAVLAVDPTSAISGGSILADKTRMQRLVTKDRAFIRPSPSSGHLGGVAHRTREAMMLCEAAGYSIVIVETVGVGQSEFAVRAMVDFFLFLSAAGAGDELQGIKRGIIELADTIVITKADGDNVTHAAQAQRAFENALQFISSPTENWQVPVQVCSAINNDGIEELWKTIERQHNSTKDSSAFHRRRQQQAVDWMHTLIKDRIQRFMNRDPNVSKLLKSLEQSVRAGTLTSRAAAQELCNAAGWW